MSGSSFIYEVYSKKKKTISLSHTRTSLFVSQDQNGYIFVNCIIILKITQTLECVSFRIFIFKLGWQVNKEAASVAFVHSAARKGGTIKLNKPNFNIEIMLLLWWGFNSKWRQRWTETNTQISWLFSKTRNQLWLLYNCDLPISCSGWFWFVLNRIHFFFLSSCHEQPFI